MSKLYLHHVLVAVDDLERARQFYADVLEMEEIERPAFNYPGIWYQIGDGPQQTGNESRLKDCGIRQSP
jgi:catechol 2,3-dioxygenase-like lactoylglutathione lyase family enzyme